MLDLSNGSRCPVSFDHCASNRLDVGSMHNGGVAADPDTDLDDDAVRAEVVPLIVNALAPDA